jgi:hypothetical protein
MSHQQRLIELVRAASRAAAPGALSLAATAALVRRRSVHSVTVTDNDAIFMAYRLHVMMAHRPRAARSACREGLLSPACRQNKPLSLTLNVSLLPEVPRGCGWYCIACRVDIGPNPTLAVRASCPREPS